MRAFIFSLVAIAVISVLSAAALQLVPMSSRDVFTERPNVRL
jgi:type II secretory pathway pseudopilin PulG